MSRRNLFVPITLGLVAVAAASLRFAQADPTPPAIDPSEVTFVPFTVQTAEPSSGFTGACLAPALTYTPQLPTVCYSPKSSFVDDGGAIRLGATRFAVPAAKVLRSYSQSSTTTYDSYQVLITCYPHDGNGACPQTSYAVSKSCCDLGTNLVSVDGKSAEGIVPLAL